MRIPVGTKDELTKGGLTPKHIDELDLDVVLFENPTTGEIRAMNDVCPHLYPRAIVKLSRGGRYIPHLNVVQCLHTCFFEDGTPMQNGFPKTSTFSVEQDEDGSLQLIVPEQDDRAQPAPPLEEHPREQAAHESRLRGILGLLRRHRPR